MEGVNKLSAAQVLQITNILRSLGFSTGLNGTKFINKAIQIYIISNPELFLMKDIYSALESYYNMTYVQIQSSIKYSFRKRNITRSKANFSHIFGYEYDDYIFTAKALIEEIARIIK